MSVDGPRVGFPEKSDEGKARAKNRERKGSMGRHCL